MPWNGLEHLGEAQGPSGLGVRQSSGALVKAIAPKAVQEYRSPKRKRGPDSMSSIGDRSTFIAPLRAPASLR